MTGHRETARRIATGVAAEHADHVHRDGRFPIEALDALRAHHLLGVLVPAELGGGGATIGDMVDVTTELAQQCGNIAMVFAMHQIQVALLVRHGDTPELQAFLRQLAADQLLVANAFSETGVGGDSRQSACAVEPTGGGFVIHKQAPVCSYALFADALLLSARRDSTAPPEDQVLALSRPPVLEFETLGEWDAIGLRGTDSRPFNITAAGPTGYIIPYPGNDVLGDTGVAVNNLLQAAVWLGIAESAAGRAHAHVRRRRDTDPGGSAPLRLAELTASLQQLRDTMGHASLIADEVFSGARVSDARLALTMNTLKVSSSTLAVDVVQTAMVVCGIDGYRNGSPFSLGRHLADVYAGLVMINNDRVLTANGRILKLLKHL